MVDKAHRVGFGVTNAKVDGVLVFHREADYALWWRRHNRYVFDLAQSTNPEARVSCGGLDGTQAVILLLE